MSVISDERLAELGPTNPLYMAATGHDIEAIVALRQWIWPNNAAAKEFLSYAVAARKTVLVLAFCHRARVHLQLSETILVEDFIKSDWFDGSTLLLGFIPSRWCDSDYVYTPLITSALEAQNAMRLFALGMRVGDLAGMFRHADRLALKTDMLGANNLADLQYALFADDSLDIKHILTYYAKVMGKKAFERLNLAAIMADTSARARLFDAIRANTIFVELTDIESIAAYDLTPFECCGVHGSLQISIAPYTDDDMDEAMSKIFSAMIERDYYGVIEVNMYRQCYWRDTIIPQLRAKTHPKALAIVAYLDNFK